MGVGAAMVGAAAIGAAGSIFGGMMSAKGADKSGAAMRYAADKSAETMLELNNRARADTAPFRQMGLDTGNAYHDLLLGGQNVPQFLQASPMFQFQTEIGTRNINRQLAARGLFGSGSGLETLAMFNKGLAADEGERIMSRLFNMTSMGANTAVGQATMTNQTGQAIGNMQAQSGIAQGNAISAQYNAYGQAFQGAANNIAGGLGNYAQYQMYSPMINAMAQRYGGSGGMGGGGAPMMDFNPSTAGQDMSMTRSR